MKQICRSYCFKSQQSIGQWEKSSNNELEIGNMAEEVSESTEQPHSLCFLYGHQKSDCGNLHLEGMDLDSGFSYDSTNLAASVTNGTFEKAIKLLLQQE